MNDINTIVFDLDGTLLDTLDDLRDALNVTLKKYGFAEKTRDEARMAVGNGLRVMMKRTLPNGESTENFEQILDDFKAYYSVHSSERTRPYDGICDVLRDLTNRGYKLAVVSNKPDEAVRELVGHYFGDYDICAVGENEKGGIPKKPAPEMVFSALRTLGAGLDAALYVGDSDVDIMTAENAGVPCISVTWGFRDEKFLLSHGAKILVHKPKDLPETIKTL